MTITVRRVGDTAPLADWLAVAHRVHAGDQAYVPQPDWLERKRVSRLHSPFSTFGEFELYVAYRNRQPIGRVSVQVNRQHLARHQDSTGHFGFFVCDDDQAAADALLDEARNWLRRRGLARIVGPVSFSLNEESGCLVEGFETPPAILMPHARPFTGRLLERTGLRKEIDLFAYRTDPTRLNAYAERFSATNWEDCGISLRRFDRKRFSDDVSLVADIYADAWRDNWGFVPFAKAEMVAFEREMPQILRDNYARFVCVDGKPAGVMVVLLNVNELFHRYQGKLLPFNWLHMLWAIRFETTRSARVPLLGIRRPYHSTPLGGLLLGALFSDLAREIDGYSLDWVEFSWVLETNRRVNVIAEKTCGKPVKTYRIFGQDLGVSGGGDTQSHGILENVGAGS